MYMQLENKKGVCYLYMGLEARGSRVVNSGSISRRRGEANHLLKTEVLACIWMGLPPEKAKRFHTYVAEDVQLGLKDL